MAHELTFPITYAHCTLADACGNDIDYELRTVDALMFRRAWPEFIGIEDDFHVEVDGKPIGYGDTKEDATGQARYRLMDASRTAAIIAARQPIAAQSA